MASMTEILSSFLQSETPSTEMDGHFLHPLSQSFCTPTRAFILDSGFHSQLNHNSEIQWKKEEAGLSFHLEEEESGEMSVLSE